MATLLEKTRKINRLLQRAESVEYDSISRVLSAVIDANVYIVNKAGKIFGHAFIDDFECDLMLANVVQQGNFPKRYVSWLLKMDETSPNLKSKTGICAFTEDTDCRFEGKNTTIVPIYGVGDRIGTLIIAK
ncbi:MAG: GTP-sensing pleiotropic transcriptional regulator CodY, partial [Selenomonas sp.]